MEKPPRSQDPVEGGLTSKIEKTPEQLIEERIQYWQNYFATAGALQFRMVLEEYVDFSGKDPVFARDARDELVRLVAGWVNQAGAQILKIKNQR